MKPSFNRKSAIENLKSLGVPIRFFQASFADIFEKFIHRREQHAGPIRVHPHFEVQFVVEKMNVAVAKHAEECAGGFEIAGVNDCVLNGESRAGFACDAVAGAGHNMVQDFRKRTENRDGEYIAVGYFHFSVAAHGAGIAPEPGKIVATAQLAARSLILVIKIGQMREIDPGNGDAGMIMRIVVCE